MLDGPHLTVPIPDDEDWSALLSAAAQGRYPCRDRTVLHCFWTLGLTVSEALDLRVDDVDCLTGDVRRAGRRKGVLPVDALRALVAYASMERRGRIPQLLTDSHGLPMSRAGLCRIFRRLSATSGVEVTPHTLRLAALYRLLRRNPVRALVALRPGRQATANAAAGGAPAR